MENIYRPPYSKEPLPSHNLVTMEDPDFIEAIKIDFGLDITDVEKVTYGWSNQVYRATLEGKTIYIRINEKPHIFPIEIAGYELMREQGIPVPNVLAYEPNPKTIGFPTMILSEASGEQLGKAHIGAEQEASIYEQMGDTLRKIHNIKLKGFGLLKVEEGKLLGKFNSLTEFWESLRDRLQNDMVTLKDNNLLTRDEIGKLEEAFNEISAVDIPEASLLHRDMQSSHVFVRGENLTGVIDLDRLEAGDPRYDIAMSFAFQNEKQKQSFKNGYGELSDDPMVKKYLLYIAARKIIFRFKNGLTDEAGVAQKIFRETLEEIE